METFSPIYVQKGHAFIIQIRHQSKDGKQPLKFKLVLG